MEMASPSSFSSFAMNNDVDHAHITTSSNYTISKVMFLSNVTCNLNRRHHNSSSSSNGNGGLSVSASNNTGGVNTTFDDYGFSNDRLDINEQIFVLCKNGYVHQLCLSE